MDNHLLGTTGGRFRRTYFASTCTSSVTNPKHSILAEAQSNSHDLAKRLPESRTMTDPVEGTATILIEKDCHDGKFAEMLRQNHLRVNERYPPVNGPIGDMLSHPAAWLSASGLAGSVATAIHAYAKYGQKRAVIKKFGTDVEIDLVNYSADEIRLIDTLDLLGFRNYGSEKTA